MAFHVVPTLLRELLLVLCALSDQPLNSNRILDNEIILRLHLGSDKNVIFKLHFLFAMYLFFASSVGSSFDKKITKLLFNLVIDFKFFDNNFNTMKTVMIVMYMHITHQIICIVVVSYSSSNIIILPCY